ncbi:MAG TPA: magnesium chelatase [Bacteroidota bacterium]|nr:magnesium chelatase [Bacteroidota bacterium]
MKPTISTRGELKNAGHRVLPVKEEVRKNLVEKLRKRETLFPGIIGFDDTVIPSIVNALLGKHDIMLLGLRGQAKSRIVRLLPALLDEYMPIVAGCEINDNPYSPVCKRCHDLSMEMGDALPVEWVHRDARLGEKLATPDVTIADLIGDIDPIKAATKKLHYSHEGAIHFGIIPRTNRGIFAINELPDLQPRIQVGLFNIMQEKDIQIRGFNVRIPLDILIVFTANPEDYTNRGNIITPLKDRIDSQIFTHYPRTIDDAIRITEQEAWIRRGSGEVDIPAYFREIIEQVAFEARQSEFVDQKSGVSARLTIAALENLVSNAERRAILNGDSRIAPRISDLPHVLPAMTGKIELVFEGEQEGPARVGKALIGKAVRTVFRKYFPDPLQKRARTVQRQEEASPPREEGEYGRILSWFESGNAIEISDDMPLEGYYGELDRVKGLRDITLKHMEVPAADRCHLAAAMEFVLDGLHQSSRIAKEEADHRIGYKDMVGTIFNRRSRGEEDD